MEKLQKLLTERRSRAALLSDKRAAAEAALAKATAAHRLHLLEGDLANEKLGAKLQSEVVGCTSTLSSLDAPLAELQAQIADVEQKIAAERAAMERHAAAEKLALDLDEIERTLPDYLTAGRRFADAFEAIHFHFEATQIARFVSNGMAQVEVATAFSLQELRGMVSAIRDGAAPIPPPKPRVEPVAAIEPAPPTQTVFMMRSAKFRDHAGVVRYARQYDDCELPVQTAERALRRNVAVPVTDPRRRDLKGARGGYHVNPNAPDLIDLDDEEAKRPPHIGAVTSDPHANFIVVDRSSEARTLEITVPRL